MPYNSSSEYPQSNGATKRVVQIAKCILKVSADNKDPFEGMLKDPNTPFEDIGVSYTAADDSTHLNNDTYLVIEFCQRFTSDSIMPNHFTTRGVEI